MENPTLPLYEVEFLPLERRLGERRRPGVGVRPGGPERRRGDRRHDGLALDGQPGGEATPHTRKPGGH